MLDGGDDETEAGLSHISLVEVVMLVDNPTKNMICHPMQWVHKLQGELFMETPP